MRQSKEYFIWCDESVKKGKFYSNFYGGVLIQSKHLQEVTKKLNEIVSEIKITEEIKWQKVDAYKLPAFKKLMDVFFDLVKENKIKVRIMFKQNALVPNKLLDEHFQNEYFLLYYQFFKHHFGLQYSNETGEDIFIRAYFDYLPDTLSKRQQFKEYIKGLESLKSFKEAKIRLRKNDITEVNSKEHLPLQFLDVVLGAMQFRLNNLHKEKPLGKRIRGKRTIAKEELYKYILKKIRTIKPNFNIGISTGKNEISDKWNHEYRHWSFKPKDFEIDKTKYK